MQPIQAQQMGFSVLSFPGIATNVGAGYFYDGGGFDLNYQHDLGKGRLVGGVEYRMINWGNQIALNMGYNFSYWAEAHWRFSGTTAAQIGLALFYQKPLIIWALEYMPQMEWQSEKRFFANLGIGFRFSNSPSYKRYGEINTTFNLPIKIGVGFRLGKRNK